MLIEAAKIPAKIAAAFPDRDLSNEYLQRIGEDTWKYTKIKTLISLLTAVATTVGLWFLGIEYSVLWGLLIFFLNFIPNIGPIIASIPPVLLALVDQGLFGCAMVTGYLVFINWVIGYGLEPRYLGEGLGISELVVLLSLIFWGWLLGPIGMFLSAPLTMVFKIVLQNNPDTRWIAVLMSNQK
jgi:predicted PurR-regulated permease PerM